MQSPRTAKYVDAMIHEGDDFDYRRWLQRVRGEEAQAKQVPAVFSSGESVAPEIGDLTNTPDRRNVLANAEPALQVKLAAIPRSVYRSDQKARGESAKDRLRRRLMRVSDAFDEFQESRVRDAIFKYLAAVFEVVVHYKGRRQTRRLLRHAFQFAGLSLDKNADPFAVVVRSTSDDRVDNKAISRWSRALRYVAYCKVPRAQLKTFMKRMGGINGWADRHTRYLGRGSR
jgi:hypothetical protein